MQISVPKSRDYMNTATFLPIPIAVLGGLTVPKDLPKIKIL